MIKILQPDFEFGDHRGTLVQLVHDDFKQINIITSNQGSNRGGHFHKLNKEAFYIIQGNIRLTVKDKEHTESYVFAQGQMFLIPAFITHSFEFLSPTILVSLYDIGVELDNGQKDIYIP